MDREVEAKLAIIKYTKKKPKYLKRRIHSVYIYKYFMTKINKKVILHELLSDLDQSIDYVSDGY